MVDALETFCSIAERQMSCDYGALVEIPQFSPAIAEQMTNLVTSRGVTLFSLQHHTAVAQGDTKSPMQSDFALCEALYKCRQLGALPIVRACVSPNVATQAIADAGDGFGPELDALSQPERSEVRAILRATLFSFHAGFQCPLLVTRIHSETALRCFLEQRHLCRGILFGQTTIPAIAGNQRNASGEWPIEGRLTCSTDWNEALGSGCQPPIRCQPGLNSTLMAHLTTNDCISVASAHCAISTGDKAGVWMGSDKKHLPRGIASLGYRLIALWNTGIEEGNIDVCAFVKSVSTDPARLANVYPKKGSISVGSDADIVVWSRTGSITATNGCEKLLPTGVYNAYSEIPIRSRPDLVFLRGQLLVERGQMVEPICPAGLFVPTKPFGQYTYGRVEAIEANVRADNIRVQREPYKGDVISSPTEGIETQMKESHFFRKEHYDNVPKGRFRLYSQPDDY